jgi:hypothetical protein
MFQIVNKKARPKEETFREAYNLDFKDLIVKEADYPRLGRSFRHVEQYYHPTTKKSYDYDIVKDTWRDS